MTPDGIVRYLEGLYTTWLEGRLNRKLRKGEQADVLTLARMHAQQFESVWSTMRSQEE